MGSNPRGAAAADMEHAVKRPLMPLMTVWLLQLLIALVVIFETVHGGAKAQAISTPAVTTNISVVITAGNTFQQVMAALVPPAQRRSLTIQNNNATDNCWVYIGAGSATKGTAILLLPGGSYTRYFPYVPADVIQATCATTSDTLYVDTQ